MGFGDKLKAKRLQVGLSQTQVANKLGLATNSYVSDAELNKFIPTEDKLKLWAEALGMSWPEMQDLVLESELEELGIKDPGFTMMFKDIPDMTYDEKQSILMAYQAVLRARAKKSEE